MGDRPFFWWEGEDLYEFFATVGRYGYDNVRIEVHVEDDDDDDEPQAFLDVVLNESDERVGHYNFSHICPPCCPPDLEGC